MEVGSPVTDSRANEITELVNDMTLGPDKSKEKSIEVRVEDRAVLEDFKPCSSSHLWKLMMSFYDRKGPDSWSQGIVPHFITCNTYIAKSYAQILHGFIRDCYRPQSKIVIDETESLYIIELGAGSGKFSYFMLKALEEMQDVCDFPFRKIKFVMTDFTEANFKYWQSHPALKRYFESGHLDAGIFNAVTDTTITLWKSGTVLSRGSCKNPIIIVANYLFDTLYHDIFQVDGGVLKEGLISVGSKSSHEPDPLHPDIIGRLENLYKYNPTEPAYYSNEEGDEKHMERILNWYLQYFKDSPNGASILIPIGAIRALRHLATFSNSRALVISGDKGNNNPEQFGGLMDPHIAVHGSFSMMVNYHAIGAWFTSRGGFALHNPQEEASLKVSTFLLTPESFFEPREEPPEPEMYLGANLYQLDKSRHKHFPFLLRAFNDFVDQFGPNDFFVLQKSLKEDLSNPPLRTVAAILKLSDWDPDVFFKFRDTLLSQTPSCGQKLRNDLCRGIPRLWTNYYILDTDKDIAFEIGRFYYGIRDYENALKYYKESVIGVGEHHVTFHNQGLCYYSLGHLETALEQFHKALSMCADYEKARSWIEKVQNDLSVQRNNTAAPLPPPQPLVAQDAGDTSSAQPPAPPVAGVIGIDQTVPSSSHYRDETRTDLDRHVPQGGEEEFGNRRIY